MGRTQRLRAWLPWIVGLALIVLALVVAGAVSLEAFGIAVGVVALAGTVGAAIDARRSAERIAGLIREGHTVAHEARAASEAARASAERVSVLAEDLAVASRAERVGRVKEAVRLVLTVEKTAQMDYRSPEVFADDPAPLTVSTTAQLVDRLRVALSLAGRLSLPSCWALLLALANLLLEIGEMDPARDKASAEQLAALMKVGKAAWSEIDRPADQIPIVHLAELGGALGGSGGDSITGENQGSGAPST